MAEPRLPDPVLLVVALFSRHPDALVWAQERLEEFYGPVALASTEYEFLQTAYYEPAMGPHLRKRFVVLRDLTDPLATLTVVLLLASWLCQWSVGWMTLAILGGLIIFVMVVPSLWRIALKSSASPASCGFCPRGSSRAGAAACSTFIRRCCLNSRD